MAESLHSSGMPLHMQKSAPRFAGDSQQLFHFLESVDRLAQQNGLSDKDCIKFALRYMEHEQRSLHGYYKGDSYEEFADEVLDMYPELGYDLHYVRPCIETTATPDMLNAMCTTCNPIDTKREPHHLEEEITPLSSTIFTPMLPLPCLGDTASSPVQDDHICPSRFSAPIQAPPAAIVVQNATTIEQSTSLDNPRITDETVLYDDNSISASLECSSDAPNVHNYVPDDPEIHLDGTRTASEEMCSHALTVCMNVPWLTRFMSASRLKLSRSKAHITASSPIANQAFQHNVLDDPHAFFLMLTPVTSYSPLMCNCTSLETTPMLSSLTLRANFPAQHAYARNANLGIAIQYRVFSAAFITKRISSTLQQTSGNQMLILHANLPMQCAYVHDANLGTAFQYRIFSATFIAKCNSMPFTCSPTHHHRSLRTVHIVQIRIQYHRPSHASIAFCLYERRSRRLCRRKKKDEEIT
ncbi:hypothetical protein BD769DRAFT_1666865 [Suillus cothurnatus]|nr:hypothetical protein BD769DRAFT_1666865 [Suillus cothurnatus]